jgi:hypothetical protein
MTRSKTFRPKEAISRAFRQDFPEFADRASALGVRISLSSGARNGRARVYWLDGYKQLTGYTTKANGSPFRHDDAARNIDKALSEIEKDRAEAAALTVDQRFARVMEQMRLIVPQYRMIGEVRLPCGDSAYCFFMAEYDGAARIEGIGDVARAKTEWRQGESSADQLRRFCDALEADFQRRMDNAATADPQIKAALAALHTCRVSASNVGG